MPTAGESTRPGAEIERRQEAARQVELERMHIARDLHDVIAHTVSVISLHSNVAGEALDDDLPAARAALARISEASGDAMRELRASIGLLRGADGQGTQPTNGLARLGQLAKSTGLPVAITIQGNENRCRPPSTRPRTASSRSRCHGLIGMRERAALLGGTVAAGEKPGGGFEVKARLPLS
jgi:signal transduction histidine kinase